MSKQPLGEQFIDNVKVCGNSAHIRLSKRWLNRRVKVTIEPIDDNFNHIPLTSLDLVRTDGSDRITMT